MIALAEPRASRRKRFELRRGAYELLAFAAETGRVHSRVLKGFELDVAELT